MAARKAIVTFGHTLYYADEVHAVAATWTRPATGPEEVRLATSAGATRRPERRRRAPGRGHIPRYAFRTSSLPRSSRLVPSSTTRPVWST